MLQSVWLRGLGAFGRIFGGTRVIKLEEGPNHTSQGTGQGTSAMTADDKVVESGKLTGERVDMGWDGREAKRVRMRPFKGLQLCGGCGMGW